MNKEVFHKFLEKYGQARIAIATHEGADVDAIACSYAMKSVLPNSTIFLSDEPKEEAAVLKDMLGIKYEDLAKARKTDFDAMIIVDTATSVLLPEAKKWKIALIIDHHHPDGRDLKGEFEIMDEHAPSTAEIVAEILPSIGKDVATALAAAVIADAKRFKSARISTFRILAGLMEKSGVPYEKLLGIAEPELKNESKIAVLKAFQRCKMTIIGQYIVVTSEVSAHESDASSLLSEAAHASFVASWKHGETRISARASPSLTVPLNRVMSRAAEGVGSGGGHPKAAGASMKLHTEEALERCIEAFRSIVEEESV